jgi:hypothetical protein
MGIPESMTGETHDEETARVNAFILRSLEQRNRPRPTPEPAPAKPKPSLTYRILEAIFQGISKAGAFAAFYFVLGCFVVGPGQMAHIYGVTFLQLAAQLGAP